MRLIKTFKLATSDYKHEWQMSSCFILALAAVLGPMLVLFGLKFGIVGGMLDQLIENPSNREIRPIGSGRYSAEWIESLRNKKEIAFIIPQTRSISATIQLKSKTSNKIISSEVIPSNINDPLLRDISLSPEGLSKVVLSESAAMKLKVKKGDEISGSLLRRFKGEKERVFIKLSVVDIASKSSFSRNGIFTDLRLLEALEDFKDGHAVPEFGWQGDEPVRSRSYPSFRLYAKSIYDVSTLRRALDDAGINVRTKSSDIDLVMKMDRNLSLIYWAIAIIGLVGFSLSLGASLWANVDRKKKELSVLRLVGFKTGDIVWFPIIQALYTGILGWALAIAIYGLAAFSINDMLGKQLSEGEIVCVLLPEHYFAALALTVVSAVLAAALAGIRSSRIAPSDGLREI
tara:strand:+ start:17562 stop:18767 length:1206 start_codon:yes stop_codon:yes gene_type:complete